MITGFYFEEAYLLDNKIGLYKMIKNINTCNCTTNWQNPGPWHDKECPNYVGLQDTRNNDSQPTQPKRARPKRSVGDSVKSGS